MIFSQMRVSAGRRLSPGTTDVEIVDDQPFGVKKLLASNVECILARNVFSGLTLTFAFNNLPR